MLRRLADGNLLLLVLVPYLAHQLFEDILHRDNAAGAAIFVHHDGNVRLALLHLFKQQTDRLILRCKDGG